MKAPPKAFLATASGLAVLLSACQPRPAPSDDPKAKRQPVTAALAENASETAICRSIKDSSEGGRAALQAAIFSDPAGQAYGGDMIGQLLKKDHPRFVGTEMNGGHCWAYLQASGVVDGLTRTLTWRCPVSAIRDNPKAVGLTMLEDVDGSKCDFGAVKGSDTRKQVSEPITRLTF